MKRNKIRQAILNLLLSLSVLVMILSAVSAVFFRNQDAFLLGYKPYIIASESMEPNYQKYAVVIVKSGNYEDVKDGEVIAFKASRINDQAAFHRVIEVTPEGFITKGDANRLADDQIVNQEAFIGREVWHSNITGVLFPLLQTPKGFTVIIILPCLFFALLIATIKVLKIQSKLNS